MSTMSAREILRIEYGDSRNLMTDKIIKRGKINRNMAFELSVGNGMYNEKIYGLSIVEIIEENLTKRRTDLSDCYLSKREAENHIRFLKDKFKNKRSEKI